MENASKALIMAAGVLIGVMILSIAVYLFTIFGNFSSETTKKISEKEITEFNSKFIKYESYKEGSEWKNLCRAQDIVTIANLAKEYNERNELIYSDKEYIKVIVDGNSFENKTIDEYKEFLRNNSGTGGKPGNSPFEIIYYICKDIIINKDTGKVCSITFTKN